MLGRATLHPTMSQLLRGFLFLFVLLPQIALASVGSSFVVCVAPGDHLQVEFASGACCESESGAETPAGDRERPTDLPECPSCEDLEVLVDPTLPDKQVINVPAAPPSSELPTFDEHHRRSERRRGHFDRLRARQHLSLERSIVLRC